jgi:hypothetical protein
MVRKIASLTNISPHSIVDTLGAPLFWTTNAIWTVAYDQGEYVLQNLTDLKIKGFLQNIPGASTYWTKGDYNRRTGVVTWLYRSTAPTTVDERTEFDKALSLNTKTGAFYPWSFTVDVNKLHGIVACENTNKEIVLKFLTSKSSGATTWAEVFDTDYIDWDVDGSTAYDSYLFSGYKPAGEGNKEFQSNYVVFHLETVSGASAFVRGIWDFSNNSLSNKWTTAQQVYNSAPTYRDYRMRKLKIRGWGKALQFYIYSEAGKPFRLTGWSVSISANQLP